MALAFSGELLGRDSLARDMAENGYALVDHGVPGDAMESVVEALVDLDHKWSLPEASTMNAMIPDPRKLDALDRAKDKQVS